MNNSFDRSDKSELANCPHKLDCGPVRDSLKLVIAFDESLTEIKFEAKKHNCNDDLTALVI